ncbi:MAG: TetR/AcrR family transcriptional regulator [Clostridiaceae bacterium]|nr:TetR/AcrR family transcriptional regulator [Clostridiaceae bacterium]
MPQLRDVRKIKKKSVAPSAKTPAGTVPGAIRPRDMQRSRAEILRAAVSEFAAAGFEGARVDRIAARAGLNKVLIYRYFGNKEDLYLAVLREVYSLLGEVERDILEHNVRGAELIEQLIDGYFDFLQRREDLVNILLWENLLGTKYLQKLPHEAVGRSTLSTLEELIRDGQTEGVFRADFDPHQLVVSLLVFSFGNFANRHSLSLLFGRDMAGAEWMEKRRAETKRVIFGYILPNKPGVLTDAPDTRSKPGVTTDAPDTRSKPGVTTDAPSASGTPSTPDK